MAKQGAERPDSIEDVLAAMRSRFSALGPSRRGQREFLETYARTTQAVAVAIRSSVFEDPGWVEAWDVAFAELYLDALAADLAGQPVPRPWQVAFAAPDSLAPVRHVLLGINAHINFDLPQALLAVIDDADFADHVILARRRRDHARIDAVLAGRVAAEDVQLSSHSARTLLDRALRPVNRAAARRFLREARMKVWHNTLELQQARLQGPATLAGRLGELEVLAAARVNDLLAPGQVLLRLAVAGFGVTLPPPPSA